MLFALCSLLFAFCSLLFASTAHAETLLATIVLPGYYFDPGAMRPAWMGFGADAPDLPGASFSDGYTVDQVGSVFDAPPSFIAAFNAILDHSQLSFTGVTMSEPRGPWHANDFWSQPQFITPHVPQLGTGLEGYNVSRFTRTVDSIVWTDYGDYLVANGQQTIRLYGGAEVPEPATWIMLLVVVVHLITLPRR
jgi:hypothetical protein